MCAYCRASPEPTEVCRGCAAVYHTACRDELGGGRCATLGCGLSRAPGRGGSPTLPRWPSRGERWRGTGAGASPDRRGRSTPSAGPLLWLVTGSVSVGCAVVLVTCDVRGWVGRGLGAWGNAFMSPRTWPLALAATLVLIWAILLAALALLHGWRLREMSRRSL